MVHHPEDNPDGILERYKRAGSKDPKFTVWASRGFEREVLRSNAIIVRMPDPGRRDQLLKDFQYRSKFMKSR